MATHSSIRSWEIPWTEEPGGAMGRTRSDTTEGTSVQFSSVAQSCPILCDLKDL